MEHIIEQNLDIVKSAANQFSQDEDLYQIGMIALWEAAEKWDGVHPFRPWARLVVRNRMIDHVRRRKAQEDELTEDMPAEEADDSETEAELRVRIKRTFKKRSRERRVLLLMVSGFTKEEIAGKMHLSKRTVDRIAKNSYYVLEAEKRRE